MKGVSRVLCNPEILPLGQTSQIDKRNFIWHLLVERQMQDYCRPPIEERNPECESEPTSQPSALPRQTEYT